MIYPENAAEKLGFLEIKELIKQKCLSDMGRYMVDKMQPLHQFAKIEKFLRQTAEFKKVLDKDQPLPFDHIYSIKDSVERARIEGIGLTEEEFYHILLTLKSVFVILHYFKVRLGKYPTLETLFHYLPVDKELLTMIEAIIDIKGNMKVNASVKLKQLTEEISKTESEVRSRMDHFYKIAQKHRWLSTGSLTSRSGRLCIPIRAEHKRKMKGFIHDESSTGRTVFLEPEEVSHLNNKVRDLEFDRRREVARILIELTTNIRPRIPLLLAYHDLLGMLDFIRAKALFAIQTDSTIPRIVQAGTINLFNARHPLLFLSFRKEKRTVVPLNIKIEEEQRIIIVSGPNAGGKSVALKTISLLQIMAQSGLLIPADAHSTMGIFQKFFVDIGDDQSIESDLSTYSAHLSKMRYFLEHADKQTLVLIDEFGTGTDPQFGGPIAEAILQTLNEKRIRGVFTTHYSNLKNFASQSQGLENASMLFDNVGMKPLYILQVGKPGSSFAFEIAQKIGLPHAVIALAKEKVSVEQKK